VWDDAPEITSKLAEAIDAFDNTEAANICEELIARLRRSDEPYPEMQAKRSLGQLRKKRMFALMQRLADAFIQNGQAAPQIRRQYAQSMLDQGSVTAAINVLEKLSQETLGRPEDQAENAEARGLLGRAYKQLYVDGADSSTRRAAEVLNRATRFYHEVYTGQPHTYLWHGINAVALMCRAQRDGVALENFGNSQNIATNILNEVKGRDLEGRADMWDFATAAEGCLALGLAEEGIRWINRYVRGIYADAFEVASTRRQFLEVWQLSPCAGIGARVIPILEASLLRCSGSCLELSPADLSESQDAVAARDDLQKVLDDTVYRSIEWYDRGRRRSLAVARVEREGETDRGIGTGFLVRGKDLKGSLGERFMLLTNAHVVSDDANVKGALHSPDARISFKAFDEKRRYQVRKILWTSTPERLDATLLDLDDTPSDVEAYPVARERPLLGASARVYIMGHPKGGGLSISLNDNRLLDYQDYLLHYRTPTEGGSSGSPVFNDVWQLIGIHHAGGFDMPRLNGKPGRYAANEGIWIQSIREALEREGL
jgi:tetratricopeptide (TPR) repeat protein